jgi:outer membrane protein OmpA-like peptidoglycan-associated protein
MYYIHAFWVIVPTIENREMKTIFILGLLLFLSSFTLDNRSYRLDDIRFETNDDKLTDEHSRQLETIVRTIRTMIKEEHKKTFTLWINGNSDSIEKNAKKLSTNRAEGVRDKLINLGLTDGKLVTRGYGKKRPMTDSKTEDHRKIKARVDFQIELE